MGSSSVSVLEMALRLAAAGVPVFALHGIVDGACTCGRKCSSPGKHPLTSKGFKDATINQTTIRGWWKRQPSANLGLPTGGPLGLLVVDCDPRNGGPETFEELRGLEPSLPLGGVRVRTGGGGLHVYLKYSGGPVPKALRTGIDLKGEGGYVVCPPSLHISGNRYEFEYLGDVD